MKSKKTGLIVSACLVLVLLASLVLAACAPEAAAPGAPTRISPQVPAPTTPSPTTPSPTKPAPTPAPAPAAEVIKLSANLHTGVGGGIWYDFHKFELPRIIEQRTNGRILIDPIYGAGELLTADQCLEGAAQGLVDFVEGSPTYWKGILPIAEVEGGLPASFKNPMESYIFMYKKGMAELLDEAYAEVGIKWLTHLACCAMDMITKERVAGLDDLQGTKICTFGPWLGLIDRLGGTSTYIVLAERYTSLATGVVDGILTTPVWMYDNKIYEVTGYLVQPHWQWGGGDQYIMNMGKWNELPADLQQTFLAACREVGLHWTMSIYEKDVTIVPDWEAQGVEAVTWSTSDHNKVIAAASVYWDEVGAKDAYTAKAVGMLKDFLREMGRLE